MTRRLIQVGNSIAVTLPTEVVKEFKLRKGQKVEVSVHPATGAVTIRPGVKYFDDGKVTKRFRQALDAVLEKRADLYRALSK